MRDGVSVWSYAPCETVSTGTALLSLGGVPGGDIAAASTVAAVAAGERFATGSILRNTFRFCERKRSVLTSRVRVYFAMCIWDWVVPPVV